MRKAWFILSKRTGKPAENTLVYRTKEEALKDFMYDKHFHEHPKGVYVKVLVKHGYIGSGIVMESDPADMTYYIKEEILEKMFYDEKPRVMYRFQWDKFEKEVWEPYFEKYYEIRQCYYDIDIHSILV